MGLGRESLNAVTDITGQVGDARVRLLRHADRIGPVDRHQTVGIDLVDLTARRGDELAIDLPLHGVIVRPAGIARLRWRVHVVFLPESFLALGAVALPDGETRAVEPKALGLVARHDFADHRPEVAFRHARVITERAIDGRTVGKHAVPRRATFHDFAIATDVVVGREVVAVLPSHVAPDRQDILGQLGRCGADFRRIGRPAGIPLGMNLYHVRTTNRHQTRCLVLIGVTANLGMAGRMMVLVQEPEALLVPVLGASRQTGKHHDYTRSDCGIDGGCVWSGH